ncbi:MAG: cell division protein FtsX [Pseudohongiellaceae bacterium]
MTGNKPIKPNLVSQHLDDFQQSWNEMRARPLASTATVLAIASTLVIPILLIIISAGLNDAIGQYSNGPTLTAYLRDSENGNNIEEVSERLLTRNDISFIEVITKSQAIAELGQLGGLRSLLDDLDNNPLPDALVITPLATDYSQLERLAVELGMFEEIERVDLDLEWLRSLQKFSQLIRTTGMVLGISSLLGFVLVIGNSVKLTVQQSEDEIKVLKLIGASDAFILRPLMYTGLLYGLLAAIAAYLIQLAIFVTFNRQIEEFAAFYDASALAIVSFSLPFSGFLLCLLGSMSLGVLASGISAFSAIKNLEP